MSGEIENILDQYFLPRELLAENTKADGRLYHTWRACLKKEYWTLAQPTYAVIKEIPKSLKNVYLTLSDMCHPNLEAVYGVLEDCDRCYAINEYILSPSNLPAGSNSDHFQPDNSLSLERFVQSCQGNWNGKILSPDERIHQALIILLQLTDALENLSSQGLIHGDIHPGNILLTDAPDWYKLIQSTPSPFCVKLIDFDNTAAPKNADHTVMRLMGAKPFVAPEILDFSHPLDRSDIYSLGCILYYAICGKSPKVHGVDPQILKNKWVNRIVRRCTASYEARYRNIAELRKDILRALQIPRNLFFKILYNIPGFRSHTIWKMGVAIYFYIALIISVIYSFILPLQRDPYSQEDQAMTLYCVLLIIVEIIVVCDAFQLGNRSSSYIYFKSTHPVLRILLKLAAAILIFFIFIVLMSF